MLTKSSFLFLENRLITSGIYNMSCFTIRRPRKTDRDEATKVGEITYPKRQNLDGIIMNSVIVKPAQSSQVMIADSDIK